MNPKRQRILLLIMLVVLAGVVARRQFFKHDWNDERDARREERAERREAQQRERDDRREAGLREREADREDREAKREEAARDREMRRDEDLGERGADKESRQNERDESRDAADRGLSRGADAGFDRTISRLSYSKHARCRMDCRKIDDSEVMEIKNNGKVNLAKSELRSKRDPKYALEGVTQDNQKVRIIFAQKDGSLVVVTVIDLDTDWTCNCN